jgi:hypothetical protein
MLDEQHAQKEAQLRDQGRLTKGFSHRKCTNVNCMGGRERVKHHEHESSKRNVRDYTPYSS